MNVGSRPRLHRLEGEWLLEHRNDTTVSEACFHRGLAVARGQNAKLWELRASVSLARLWRSQRREDDARDVLGPVYNWFTEGFDTADLTEAEILLDELR